MKSDRYFWIDMMNELNAEDEAKYPRVLEELCTFFGFGCGFIYLADYTGLLTLRDEFAAYDNGLPLEFALKNVLEGPQREQLAASQVVSCRQDTEKDPLTERMQTLLGAQSMVLIPVVDQDQKLIALVGLADRRGTARMGADDFDFIRSVLGTLANYVKMKLYQERVEATKDTLDGIINNMGVDVYVNDFDTHEILYLNRSMAAPYGGVEEMTGTVCWQSLYADKAGECDYCPKWKLIDEDGDPTKVYTWDYQRPFDGSWFRVLSAAYRWIDGRMAHIVTSVDITENKANEQIIQQLAEFDHLTHLPNRFKMNQDCDELINKKGHEGYLLFFDLDGFKKVNDTMGHRAGDELLVRMADMLMAHAATRNRCYRYGGDEFVVLADADTPGGLKAVLNLLLHGLSQPFHLEEGTAQCNLSVGISCYPQDTQESSQLLRYADQAMYAAKRSKGTAFFYNGGDICPMDEYFEKHDVI